MAVKKKTRRGTPHWVIEISYRHAETGERVRFRKDADVQLKAAAEAEERRYLLELQERGYIRTSKQKMAETKEIALGRKKHESFTFTEAYDAFKETKAITRLKFTTRRGYERTAKVYLLPRWGTTPVTKIGFIEFERLDAELRSASLRPTTRTNIMNVGRSVLRHCVDVGVIEAMPRLPRLPQAGDVVVRVPNAEAINSILIHAAFHVRLALCLCTDAGLRAGEVCGLEWQDIDTEAGTLVVRQTVYHGQKDTPKSGHQRKVPLTPRLRELLEEAAKRTHKATDPVAPSARGTVWAEGSLIHALHRVLDRLGLPRMRVHDLRHYYVTSLFKVGVGAAVVRDLAGHRHLSVTARYAHSDETARREAVQKLQQLAS